MPMAHVEKNQLITKLTNQEIKTQKSRGRGKPKYKIMSTDQLTGYEQEILVFDDYTKASETLYKIVTALDERRSRIDCGYI
jgi:hypothetical protein